MIFRFSSLQESASTNHVHENSMWNLLIGFFLNDGANCDVLIPKFLIVDCSASILMFDYQVIVNPSPYRIDF